MKTITTLALALALALAITSSQAIAKSEKCTVTAVDNGIITLDCKNKGESFKVGAEVRIKTAKAQKKAIEGC